MIPYSARHNVVFDVDEIQQVCEQEAYYNVLGLSETMREAASAGDTLLLNRCISSGANLEAGDAAGRTALWLAAFEGRDEQVRQLLQAGAFVDARDDDGSTALAIACQYEYSRTVHLLIQGGADVNAADNEGQTPLQKAVEQADPASTRMLVDAGARFTDEWLEEVSEDLRVNGAHDLLDLLRAHRCADKLAGALGCVCALGCPTVEAVPLMRRRVRM